MTAGRAALLAAAFLVATASTPGIAKTKKYADVAAFAEQTIALLSDPNYGLDEDRTIRIKPYLTGESDDEQRLGAIADQALKAMIAIGEYSINLAMLSEWGATDTERIAAFADNVEQFHAEIVSTLGMKEQAFDATIADIRAQTSFLWALRAAQPIINAIGRYMQELLNEYESLVDQVVDDVDTAIDADYAPVLEYAAMLDDRRARVLLETAALHEAEAADGRDRGKEENLLIAVLDRINRVDAVIDPHLEIYRETHRELNEIYRETADGTAAARMTMLIWVRAHKDLAEGRKDRENYFEFDFNDLGVEAFRLGREFVKKG